MIMGRFPSRRLVYCGIIRIHEDKTCEIPLLSCSILSLWSSASPMLFLQEDLVNSSQKTRTSKCSYLFKHFESSVLREVHTISTDSTATQLASIKSASPIPSGVESFCYRSKSSRITFWAINFISRRSLVPFSWQALDSIFNGIKVFFQAKKELINGNKSLQQSPQDHEHESKL